MAGGGRTLRFALVEDLFLIVHARLDPDPRGEDLALTWNGSELELTIDELPASPTQASALERIASSRVDGAYAAHAHRLRGDAWEVSILPL